jgi:putative tryptophan/tyrosine transport system substrate-binding protein
LFGDLERCALRPQEGLRQFGYVEGQNIAFEMRNAEENGQQLAAFANELVALKVDVILAVNTPAARSCFPRPSFVPIRADRKGRSRRD